MSSGLPNPFKRRRPIISFQRNRTGDNSSHRGVEPSNTVSTHASNTPLEALDAAIGTTSTLKTHSETGDPFSHPTVVSTEPSHATEEIRVCQEPTMPNPIRTQHPMPRQGIPRSPFTPQARYRRLAAEMKAPRPPVKRVPLEMVEHTVPALSSVYLNSAPMSPFQRPFPVSKRVPLEFEVHSVIAQHSKPPTIPYNNLSAPELPPLNTLESAGSSDPVPGVIIDKTHAGTLDTESGQVSHSVKSPSTTSTSTLRDSFVDGNLFVPETPKGSSQASIHFGGSVDPTETQSSHSRTDGLLLSLSTGVRSIEKHAKSLAPIGEAATRVEQVLSNDPILPVVFDGTDHDQYEKPAHGNNHNDPGIEEDLTVNEDDSRRAHDNSFNARPDNTSAVVSEGNMPSREPLVSRTTTSKSKGKAPRRSRAPSRERRRKEPKTPKYVLEDDSDHSNGDVGDKDTPGRGRKRQRLIASKDEDEDEYAEDRRRFNPSRAAKTGTTHHTLVGALQDSFSGSSRGKGGVDEDTNDGPDLRTWMNEMFGQLWWPGFDPHHRAWERYNAIQGLSATGRAVVPDVRYTFEQQVVDAVDGEDLGRWGYIKDPGKGFQELPYDTLYEGLDDAISQLEGELTWTLSRVQVSIRTQLKNLIRYRSSADNATGALQQYTLKMHKILEGASSMAQFKAALRCISIKEELRLMRRQRCLTARLTINEMLSDPNQDSDNPTNLNWGDLLFQHARYIDESVPHNHNYDVDVVQEHPPTMMNYSSEYSRTHQKSVRLDSVNDLNSIRDVDMFMETSIATPRSNRAQHRRVYDDDIEMRLHSDVIPSDAMEVIPEDHDDEMGVSGDEQEGITLDDVPPGSDMAGVEDGQ